MSSRNRHESSAGARGRPLNRERFGLPKELRPGQTRAIDPRPPRNERDQKPARDKAITEKPLYRSIVAPLNTGLEAIHKAAAVIAQHTPGAQPLSDMWAIILGQHELLATQRAANTEGHALKPIVDTAVRGILTDYADLSNGPLQLSSPLKIADPTDPNSGRYFAAYGLRKPGGGMADAEYARQRVRSRLENVAHKSGRSARQLGTLAIKNPFIPVAILTDSAAFNAADYEFSPHRLGLGPITLGALVLHQEPGLPQFSTLPATEPQ